MEGQWYDGKLYGYGRWLNHEGNCYIGRFDDDTRHTRRGEKAVYFWNNGDVYEGSWHNNRHHGEGTFYYAKTGESFSGEW